MNKFEINTAEAAYQRVLDALTTRRQQIIDIADEAVGDGKDPQAAVLHELNIVLEWDADAAADSDGRADDPAADGGGS